MESSLKRLESNKHLLFVLHKAKPKLRKAILNNSEVDLIKSICEIVFNTINKNFPINSKTVKKLRKYKKTLRCLGCSKKPLHLKKKILIQQGGFLPTLIASVLSGLLSRFGDGFIGNI